MRYRDLVTEVHHSDLYPKAFADFLTKYRPFTGRGDLYVNFTDHTGNTLDKSFSPKPNHEDPAGLYAYPLEYVVHHPANIQYGQQARFLRVIQDTSRNKLVLPTMTQEQALSILTRRNRSSSCPATRSASRTCMNCARSATRASTRMTRSKTFVASLPFSRNAWATVW